MSAGPAPCAVAGMPELPTSDDGLLADIADLGATDPDLLADEEFAELITTAVQADLQDNQSLRLFAPGVRIRADICVLGAHDDDRVDSRGPAALGKPHRGRLRVVLVRRRAFLSQRAHRRRRRSGARRCLRRTHRRHRAGGDRRDGRRGAPAASTPPRATGNCCPTAVRRWARFPPTEVGKSVSCSQDHAATVSRRSMIVVDSLPVQRCSTRSSSAFRRVRPSRWIRSSVSRFGCPGVHWKTAASILTIWPGTTWAALSAPPRPDMGPR